MTNLYELSSLSRMTLEILAVMFWGMMKAFFWQSLKQAKSSGGMGWNSRGLAAPLCLVMLFEEAKPSSSPHYAGQVFVSRPNFDAKYFLRLWIVDHFPTRDWFDSGCGAIWLGNVWNVFWFLLRHSVRGLICHQLTELPFFTGRERDEEILQRNVTQWEAEQNHGAVDGHGSISSFLHTINT